MALKPDGDLLSIREQIVDDPVSGLTFQFHHVPGSSAPFRIRVFGALPYGNREILFDSEGAQAGAGTSLTGRCRASWLRPIDG